MGVRHLLLLTVIVASTAPTATAQHPWPGYQVITPQPALTWQSGAHFHSMQPPASPPPQLPTSPGVVYTPAQPYAYGYFGAHPQRKWSRHSGYYGARARWSSH